MHDFQESRQHESEGLRKKDLFKTVHIPSIRKITRMYGTRLVNEVRYDRHGSRYSTSQLAAQNYKDHEARHLPTKSSTISKIGQRSIIYLFASNQNEEVYLSDIKQACTESDSLLERIVYLLPVPESGLPKAKVWISVKTLYGTPEAGLYCFLI